MKPVTLICAGTFIIFSSFIMKKETNSSQILYHSKWSLRKIYHNDIAEEVHTRAFIKFDREKKSAGGNGSCNTFGSSTKISGNKINFSNIFSTKMYCEEVQQTEDTFFKFLALTNRYEVKGKVLTLYKNKEVLLQLISE